MTTAVRPLPAHGTYARANGSPNYRDPCPCAPCARTRSRRKKQYRINTERGLSSRVDSTPAREALAVLHQTMTWTQIAQAADTGVSNIQEIAAGRRPTTRRDTVAKILAVQPCPAATDPNKFVDSTGSSRRLQAMRAIGHSLAVLEPLTGSDRNHLSIVCLGHRPTVRQHVAARIAKAYKTLAAQPAPKGLNADATRRYAATQGWAPPGAWDDIDDPDATPDWTGHCGTDRGWWMHSVNNIPVCQPCAAAHEAWKEERAHLEHDVYWGELGRARGAASNRGISLATDARELMRVCGLSTEQAAERLGVTRNHLQQTLLRHPADEVVDEVVDEDDLAVAA